MLTVSPGISIDRALLELSSARCHWRAFEVATGEAVCRVRRVENLPEGNSLPLEGSLAPWGFVRLEGDELLAHIPDDVYAAESVLRIAYQYATVKAGGILVHASGVAWDGKAVVAIGRSGAGKSTLGALCSSEEGRGTLLSDEIIQLYSNGTCSGTPFRSNVENVGAPGVFKLASLLSLHHANEERMTPLSPHEAMPEFLGQVYRSNVVPLSNMEILKRLGGAMEHSSVHRLSFRKNPAVGPFLRNWVRGQA